MKIAFSNDNGNGPIWSAKSAGYSWQVSWWEKVWWPWLPVNNEKSLIRCVQSEMGTWMEVLRIRVDAQKSWHKEGCSGVGGSRKKRTWWPGRGVGTSDDMSSSYFTWQRAKFQMGTMAIQGLLLWDGWQVGIPLDMNCFVNNVTLILSESSLGWWW